MRLVYMTALHRIFLDNLSATCLYLSFPIIDSYMVICDFLYLKLNKSIPSLCKLKYSNIITHTPSSHLPVILWCSVSAHPDTDTENGITEYNHPGWRFPKNIFWSDLKNRSRMYIRQKCYVERLIL